MRDVSSTKDTVPNNSGTTSSDKDGATVSGSGAAPSGVAAGPVEEEIRGGGTTANKGATPSGATGKPSKGAVPKGGTVAEPRKVAAPATNTTATQSSRPDGVSVGQTTIAERSARRRQKKRNKRIAIAVVVILLVVFAGAAAYVAYLNGLMGIRDEQLLASLKEQSSDEPFYLLMLGVDKGEERIETDGADDSNYRSDTIMLARIDPHNTKATIVSIHRDLLVDLEDGTKGKINSAFSLGGPSGMVRAVSQLAGVDIHHYAEIDFDSFMSVVDSLGGVEVTLPVAVHDPDYTGLNLEAGTQVLNGHDALMLCRARHAYDQYGDGDLYRAANQRMIIASIVRKILASGPHAMISSITTIAQSLTTDFTVNEILSLAAQMRDFNTETDLYTGMTPSEPEVIDGIYYEILDTEAWSSIMQRVDAGLPPYENESADETRGIAGSTSAATMDPAPTTSGAGSPASTSSSSGESTSSGSSASSSTENSGGSSQASITIMGPQDGNANFLANELVSLGFSAAGYEDADYLFTSNVIVIDDPAYEETAYSVAACLGEQFTVVYNDGSYYMPSPILVRVAAQQ